MDTPFGDGRPARKPLLGTALLVIGAIAGVNLIVAAFVIASHSNTGPSLPAAIERLIPNANGQIRLQEDVGADLLDTYTGVLIVDGHEIPEDQLLRIVSLGQVFFRPGDGKDITRFSPGRHTVTVEYWKQVDARSTSRSFTWQITAA